MDLDMSNDQSNQGTSAATPAGTAAPEGTLPKMLIIDDSMPMRSLLQHIGGELRFRTETAVDGRDGLEKLIKNDPRDPYAIALVDWEMPEINGLQLVQMLRRNPDFNDMKIMLVTTMNTLERVVEAMSAGANEFLMKPVSKESLSEKLQMLGLLDLAA
jgi:two-component system chemotaxis response regulator CheY